MGGHLLGPGPRGLHAGPAQLLAEYPCGALAGTAHNLSTEARDEAWVRSLPMKNVLGDVWVLLQGDCVCLSPSVTLDSACEDHLLLGKHLTGLLRAHPGAGLLWTSMVDSGAFSNQQLNTLLGVRATPLMHSTATSSVLCPFCRQPVPGWGAHLPGGCIKLAQALLYAFRAVASHLASLVFDIHWRSVTRFIASSRTVPPVDMSLTSDVNFATSQLSHRNTHRNTWSGLWISQESAGLDLHWDDMLHHYARALILAACGETWPFFEDVGDQGSFSADFAAPWRVAAQVQSLVQAVGCAE